MKTQYANFLLKKTIADYNKIAGKFAMTRNYLPKDLLDLGNYISEDDKVLDLGCGNGRFFEVVKDKKANYTGADTSEKLLELAKLKYKQAKFDLVEPLSLPYPDHSFDKIFSLAVFHHLPSKQYRLKYLQEIKRVLKPSGQLILTVWDLNSKFSLLDFIKSKLQNRHFDWRDMTVTFTDETNKVDRYVHIFTKNELASLLQTAGFCLEKITTQTRGKKNNQNIISVSKKEGPARHCVSPS